MGNFYLYLGHLHYPHYSAYITSVFIRATICRVPIVTKYGSYTYTDFARDFIHAYPVY